MLSSLIMRAEYKRILSVFLKSKFSLWTVILNHFWGVLRTCQSAQRIEQLAWEFLGSEAKNSGSSKSYRSSRLRATVVAGWVLAKSCPTFWDTVDCSTPGSPILHCFLEFAQTRVHWVRKALWGLQIWGQLFSEHKQQVCWNKCSASPKELVEGNHTTVGRIIWYECLKISPKNHKQTNRN